MVITTEMMVAKGACKFQTDIMDSLGGSLDTANVAACTVAAKANLDLMWLARKFIGTPNIDAAIRAAREGAEDAKEAAKAIVTGVYTGAKETYDGIMLVLTGQADPQKALNEGLAAADEAAETAIATAQATAFSALFEA